MTADGPAIRLYGGKSAHRHRGTPPDGVISDLAGRQHGVVALTQLVDLGLTVRTVDKRVGGGRLHRVHQGVYAVGHPALTADGRRMAAVLACGLDAVLSHRSAAALWDLRLDERSSIDVTAPNRRGRIPKGIDAHRHGSVRLADRTSLKGIPCTTVARTLLDLAGVVGMRQLEKAISEAEVLRLFDLDTMREVIARSRGRRGIARLRLLVSELDPRTKLTRSELERRFLALCGRAGLPPPEVNVPLALGRDLIEADFLWRDARLIVEADGRAFHDTASAFERDRRRDQRLMLAGWQVIRCTWRQVVDEPADLARTLRKLLATADRPPMG